jgi:tRNA modification GTPase
VLPSHTILAPASATGRSPRAIVRLSGAETFPTLLTLLESVEPIGVPAPGTSLTRGVYRAKFRLAAGPLPVLLLVFPGPRSYTGQDVAELLLPGNPHVVHLVCERLQQQPGVRPAAPGEFSARAYLSGRLTLEQAEGVAATIAAHSDEQLAAASELLSGLAGTRSRDWCDRIASMLALVEAGIDFTDQEDVVAIAPADLAGRLDVLDRELSLQLGGLGERVEGVPTAALVGVPNSGKSTLFNAMLGRERAVVSDQVGTTRDVLVEEIDLSRDVPGAGVIAIEDLPGLDPDASGIIDQEAQLAAIEAAGRADVLLWCDPSGVFDPTPPVAAHARQIVRVRTKADRAWADRPLSSSALKTNDDIIAVCALDGYNLSSLRRILAERCTSSRSAGIAALLPRHRHAMAACRVSLRAARERVDAAERSLAEPELVAAALRDALDAMGELSGRISPDEVLGRVFASFCIGK